MISGLYGKSLSIPFSPFPFPCPLPPAGRWWGDLPWKNDAIELQVLDLCRNRNCPPWGAKGVFQARGPYHIQVHYIPWNYTWEQGLTGLHQSFRGSRKQEKLSYRFHLQLKESSVIGKGSAVDNLPTQNALEGKPNFQSSLLKKIIFFIDF